MFLYGFVLTYHGAFSRILWFGNYVFLSNIAITLLGGEGAGRSTSRLRSLFSYLVVRQLRFLSSIAITLLGGEGAGRSTSRLLVCPHYVAPRFSAWIIRIEIEHPLWLTAAILDSENVFLFYDVIDMPCNKFLP